MGEVNVSPDFDIVMGRLDDVSKTLSANAEESEELGRLTDESARALIDSGVLRVCIPKELGGYEFSPRQLIQTIEKISYADASAGWAFMALQMVTGTTAAYLGEEAAAELFPDVAHGEHALIAGQGTRLGIATKVDGGYLVSGSWQFASGSSMATHIHTAGFCEETGEALIFTFPVEQTTLIDNWDVMGLRATSSNDYNLDNLFVPDAFTYQVTISDPVYGGALYKMGLANMSGIAHTGWALGVGRRMLDEMRTLAVKKSSAPHASVNTQQFYAEYAEAEAALRSARAWVMEVWADNEATLDRGEPLSVEQQTMTRLMLNNTTWSVHALGQTVYKWAATAALRRGVLQRFFRDLHAGTQHMSSGPVVLQNTGKWLAGLAPNSRWQYFDLVDAR